MAKKLQKELKRIQNKYGKLELQRELRRIRRHWFLTPAEKLERRYDAALFDLIGAQDKEAYWNLYKLTPKQAKAKGMI